MLKRKLIGGTLLMLALLGVFFYLGLPFFAKPILSTRLDIHGVKLVELEMGLPGPRGVAIRQLIVEHQDAGRLSFFNGHIDYSEPKGIAVTIDRVKHQLSKIEYVSPVSPPSQNVLLSSLLPDALLSALPNFSLAIKTLDSEPYEISLQQLNLVKHNRGLSLETGLTYRDPELVQQLSVDILTDNTLGIHVAQAGDSEPWLSFDLRIDALDKILEGQIRAKTMIHRDQVARLFALESPVEKAVLDFDFSFSLPDHSVSDDSILNGLSLQGRSLISAHLDEVSPDKVSRVDADIYSRLSVSERIHGELFSQPSEVAYLALDGEQEHRVLAALSKPLKLSLDPHTKAWPHALLFESGLTSTLVYNEEKALDLTVNNIVLDEQRLRYALKADLARAVIPDLGEGISILDDIINLDLGLVSDSEGTQLVFNNPISLAAELASLEESGFSVLKLTLPQQEFYVSHETGLPSSLDVKLSTQHEQSQSGLNADVGLVFTPDIVQLGIRSEPFDYNSTLFPELKLEASASEYFSASPSLVFSAKNACDMVLAQGKAVIHSDKQMLNLVARQEFSQANTLHHWLNTDELPVNFTAGVMDLELNAVFSDKPLAYDLDLKLRNADSANELGIFEDIQFLFSSVSLASRPSASDMARPSQMGKVKLNIARANLGVMLENLVLTGDLSEEGDDYYFDLQEGVVSVFGGQIKLHAGKVKIDNAVPFDVLVENMNLAQIVETQQVNGLVTTGTLSGRLPLEYKNGNIVLRDGKLQSQQGGLIQYTSPLKDSTDLNEQLRLTLDVLENFNYELLNTEVNYSDGTLKLSSKISGQNPDVAGGQRADLNLNTEVALDSSIQVMRLQSGLSSQLQKIVEKNVNTGSISNICQSGQ